MPPLPRHSVVLLVQFWNLPLTPTTVRPDPDSNQTAECRYLLDTLAPIGALRRFTLRPGSRLTRSFLVGKAGFEPAASASRTLRANQAAPLPEEGRA